MTTGKKVAILGGAFDPIHLDHLRLAEACLAHGCADEVWLTPSPSVRWDKKATFSSDKRLEWIEDSIEGLKNIYTCSLEIEWGQYRGAYIFLSKIRALYPKIEFHLMMGADTYDGILQWRDPLEGGPTNGKQLIQDFPLILFARQGYDFPSLSQHKALNGLPWQSLNLTDEISDISSTQVRNNLSQGIDVGGLLPLSIVDQVKEQFENRP